MNNIILKFFTFILSAFVLMGLTIDAKAASYGGEIILATSSDPKTFNPITQTETSSSIITGQLFEGLTSEDPFTLKIIPNLALSWKVSPDGLVWTFNLRQDVKWFDGKALTADDVVFTFNDLIYNPQIANSSKDIFTLEGKAFEVKKIDDYTVEFKLPQKFAPFLRSMSQAILPKHALTQMVKEGKFMYSWGIDSKPVDIIGTGPFYLHQYKPGEKVVLRRNPHYWKKDSKGQSLPYLDQIIYLIIPDPQAILLRFMDKQLDVIGISGEDYPLIKPLEGKLDFSIVDSGPDFGSSFIVFNQNPGLNPKTHNPYVDPIKRSWFENINFKRAIACSIDKSKMVQILFNEFGVPQDGPMSPSSGFFYNPNTRKYPYDQSIAKKYLEEGGFVLKEGALLDKDGHRVEFNLSTYSSPSHSGNVQMANMIKSDLEKLGMKVNFVTLEFNSLVSKLMASYDWDAVLIGLTGGVEPHFGKNVWSSEARMHLWNPNQKTPATTWEKKIDEIYNVAASELDENNRKALYDQWQELVSQELPLIYTVLATKIYAIRNRFGNLKPSAYAGVLHNVEEIYIK